MPVPLAVAWKIQGDQGGEDIADVVRGPGNNGGLDGERAGWYLLPAVGSVGRRRIARDHDRDPSVPRGSANYRALLFVNGWNMGQYIANVGPQHTFVVPNGVLNPHGENTLALAVTSDGGAGNGLERVALTDLGTVRGGVPLRLDHSPGYAALAGRLLRPFEPATTKPPASLRPG